LTRLNREPFVHGDVEIAAGTVVSLAVATANRDQELNPESPERFDIRRSAPKHLTFGFGPHYCLGASLARQELSQLLAVMADRFETLEIVGDVPRRPVMGVYGVRALSLVAP
jgi:cytochrome P450